MTTNESIFAIDTGYMNLQQLSYIVAVDDHRHFGQAADSCHVTQATLSAMIKRLEEELGVLLFDRSRKPVVPTEKGTHIISQARQMLLMEQELRASAIDGQGPSGLLRIGVIPTVANALLPMVLEDLMSTYPDLRLEVQEMTTKDIISSLRGDALDMGILATPISDEDFFFHPLYREEMMVYGVTEDEKEFVLPKELKGENVWLLEEAHCFRQQAMTLCEIKPSDTRLEQLTFTGGSFDTLLHLTDRFGGFTMVPELFADRLPAARRRKCRHFRSPRPVRQISAMTYRSETKKKAVRAVCELIKEAVGKVLPPKRGKQLILGVEV